MKTIEPVQVWYNGEEVQATVLNAIAMDITLNISANFNYYLFKVNENGYLTQVNMGTIRMDGQDYQNWTQDSYAWDWVANKLNLTITGEYIPPSPASLV